MRPVPSTLRSPLLRRIVVAYTINRLGTWFGYVALSVAVYDHTHSAPAVAALLVAGQALPAFLVPGLVARVETSSRRANLSGLYAFEAIATVALAVLVWNFWLPAILVLVALDGTASLAASALLRAETARAAREHLEERQRTAPPSEEPLEDVATAERRANAALNMAFSCTFVLGPGLAGLVVAAAGGASALLIDAASFLLCAGLLVDLSPRVEEAEQATVRTRLQAAWGHIGEAPPLARLLLAEAIALIFFAADASIEVPYAKTTLNVGDRGYGLILTVWGIGAGLGSLAFARAMRRPLGAMLSGGALAVGLAYLGFAAAPSLAFACAASLVGGLGNGVQWASMLSAVQQLTPPSLQGQIMGVVEAIGAFFPGLGLLLGGALVAIGSPRSAFLVVGIGAALMTVAFVRISADSRLEPAQPGAVAASGGESGG